MSSPAPAANLRATTESQLIQNRNADRQHLSRLKNNAEVARFARLRLLSEVAESNRNFYLSGVPAQNRYLRPWSKLFLDRISRQFRSRFGNKMRITSLLRTVAYQDRLAKRNGNAASAYGEKRSTHLTGASLDISKKGMTRAERAWVRGVLSSLMDADYLFAVEEFQQPNFHVMIFRIYRDYVAKVEASKKR